MRLPQSSNIFVVLYIQLEAINCTEFRVHHCKNNSIIDLKENLTEKIWQDAKIKHVLVFRVERKPYKGLKRTWSIPPPPPPGTPLLLRGVETRSILVRIYPFPHTGKTVKFSVTQKSRDVTRWILSAFLNKQQCTAATTTTTTRVLPQQLTQYSRRYILHWYTLYIFTVKNTVSLNSAVWTKAEQLNVQLSRGVTMTIKLLFTSQRYVYIT